VSALRDAQALVTSTADIGGLEIHFFPRVLSNVRDEKFARQGVEAEPPRITKSEGQNIVASEGFLDEGVILGNRVGEFRVDVNAQEPPKESRPSRRGRRLGPGERCALRGRALPLSRLARDP
jgi:hypothetical protein